MVHNAQARHPKRTRRGYLPGGRGGRVNPGGGPEQEYAPVLEPGRAVGEPLEPVRATWAQSKCSSSGARDRM
jgi:hypothetical protein